MKSLCRLWWCIQQLVCGTSIKHSDAVKVKIKSHFFMRNRAYSQRCYNFLELCQLAFHIRKMRNERFLYSDGTRQQPVWTLTPDGPGRWRGRAGDVVGEGQS